MAKSLGYFQQEGVKVTVADMAGSSKVMEALLGGSADIGAGSLEQSIQMAAEGHPIQTFLTEFFNFGFSLVASPKASRPITKLEDLRGATVGVTSPGSQSHLLVSFLLNRHGLRAQDYSTVSVGLGASNFSALEQGRIDAAITTPNVLLLLQSKYPHAAVLFDPLPRDSFEEVFGVPRYPSHVLYARLNWIEQNKPAVHRVAKAVVRALQYIAVNSPEVVASKIPAGYRTGNGASDVAALKRWKMLYSSDGVTPPSSFSAVRAVTALSVEKVRSTY
ncbi:MAG: ABC transporter substrate-binding protein, partial [Bryobacteraceae bacterium]